MKKMITLFYIICCIINYSYSSTFSLYSDECPELKEEVIKKIPNFESLKIKSVTSLGGVINNNFEVQFYNNESIYIFKVTNPEQDYFTDRHIEAKNQNKVYHQLKIAPRVKYVTSDRRIMVIEYVKPTEITSVTLDNISQYAECIARLHTSSINFENDNSYLKQLNKLKIKCNENNIHSENSVYFDQEILKLQDIIDDSKIVKGPCHNDLNLENILFTMKGLQILDWEFSGQNDCAWDVAYFLMASRVPEEIWSNFFQSYFSIYHPDQNFMDRVMFYRPFILISLGRNLQLRMNDKKLITENIKSLVQECFAGAVSLLSCSSFQKAKENLIKNR